MPETRTYTDGGINWNWYLQGRFDDAAMTVHVLFYERWHKYEQERHPKAIPEHLTPIRLLETPQRVVTEVKIGLLTYRVTNPAYVFSYRDFSELVMEGSHATGT